MTTIPVRLGRICACLALTTLTPALGARYDIDPTETRTTYQTKYLGVIPVRGIFERMSGTLNYEPTKPVAEREASIHVIIDSTTLKPTNFDSEAKRNMMRGPEFFDVERYPTIEFKSSKFRYEGEKLIAIDGNITLVGITKPVTLAVMKSGCEPATATRPARCTASTELAVKRFEFGIKGWAGTVSDEVKIAVDLVAVVSTSSNQPAAAASANTPAASAATVSATGK